MRVTHGGAQVLDSADAMNTVASQGEMVGVSSMVVQHIQMLGIFWGSVLVVLFFRLRRRIFGGRSRGQYYHGPPRSRLLNH